MAYPHVDAMDTMRELTTIRARDAASLRRDAAAARQLLRPCNVCERRCGVDRTGGPAGPCRLGDQTYVFREYLSVTEEAEVVPAWRVYLGGCNFRCGYCDTAPECFEFARGMRVNPPAQAARWRQAMADGARCVSILGGEPTLHPHTLLEIAAADPDLPLVVNTNLYMTPEVLDLLEGAVSLYLGDFKFGNDNCAHRLAGVRPYVDIVQRNIEAIAQRTPLIVRHVLLPGHLECCYRPVVDWLSDSMPGTRFELYTGFVPCGRAGPIGVGRLNSVAEEQEACAYLRSRRLAWEANSHAHA